MIWWKVMTDFVERLKGKDSAKSIIPPWHHELTPERQKRNIEKLTQAQKETVDHLRMEMQRIAEQHRLDS